MRKFSSRLELDPAIRLPEPAGLQREGREDVGRFLRAIARDTLRPAADDLRPSALRGIPATGERLVSSFPLAFFVFVFSSYLF